MDIKKLQTFDILSKKMLHHAQNQSIIAENIANVDTPNYKRKKLVEPDFMGMVRNYNKKVPLQTTNSKHVAIMQTPANNKIITTDEPIKLDMEAFDLQVNNDAYSQATIVYKKMLALLRMSVESKN